MVTTTRVYWATTILLCFAMSVGGIADVIAPPEVAALFEALGYPAYFSTILGVWKVLGAFALLIPGRARLKEWAYAGFTFDLSGAFFSHLAVGDGVERLAPPLALLAVSFVSWWTAPPHRTVGAHDPPPA